MWHDFPVRRRPNPGRAGPSPSVARCASTTSIAAPCTPPAAGSSATCCCVSCPIDSSWSTPASAWPTSATRSVASVRPGRCSARGWTSPRRRSARSRHSASPPPTSATSSSPTSTSTTSADCPTSRTPASTSRTSSGTPCAIRSGASDCATARRSGATDRPCSSHPADGEPWNGLPAARPLDGLGDAIALVPVIGHTRGHAAVAVDTGAGRLLHAGDAYFHPAALGTASARSRGALFFAGFEFLMAADQGRMRRGTAPCGPCPWTSPSSARTTRASSSASPRTRVTGVSARPGPAAARPPAAAAPGRPATGRRTSTASPAAPAIRGGRAAARRAAARSAATRPAG